MACSMTASNRPLLDLIANRAGAGDPVRASELLKKDLNDLCVAGFVELAMGDEVTVTLSPMGRAARQKAET